MIMKAEVHILTSNHSDSARLDQLVRERFLAFSSQNDVASNDPDQAFRFPVMAALAPVASSCGGEVAYPGDPMCLYAALRDSIQRSVERRRLGVPHAPSVDNVYPDWGVYPDMAYRRSATGPRTGLILHSTKTDGKVFDSRVWNAGVRRRFETEIDELNPLVLMISSVSAGHLYALEMAEVAKQRNPECVVILGGRHADETMFIEPTTDKLMLDSCSTVEVVRCGLVNPVVDFVVSGDGSPALDLLLRGIALAVQPQFNSITPEAVVEAVRLIACGLGKPYGNGLICLVREEPVFLRFQGRAQPESEKPSPYEAFSIRARFDIFPGMDQAGVSRRTAHFMTNDACPFGCSFCSESIQVMGAPKGFKNSQTRQVASRVKQLVTWGAGAVFFDDPVFWKGNWRVISAFCRDLCDEIDSLEEAESAQWEFEWGAQLTVDVILNPDADAGLHLMQEAGCTYIYIGIESMAESVIRHVAKNLQRKNSEPWTMKVRKALSKIQSHGLRAGSSVLFGLKGEDRTTIEETIEQIGSLIDDGLLIMASPNILTYHPRTAVRFEDGREDLDYHSRRKNGPPYSYFEEAYPDVVSKRLTEDDIWYIHQVSARRWRKVRNTATIDAPMLDLKKVIES